MSHLGVSQPDPDPSPCPHGANRFLHRQCSRRPLDPPPGFSHFPFPNILPSTALQRGGGPGERASDGVGVLGRAVKVTLENALLFSVLSPSLDRGGSARKKATSATSSTSAKMLSPEAKPTHGNNNKKRTPGPGRAGEGQPGLRLGLYLSRSGCPLRRC